VATPQAALLRAADSGGGGGGGGAAPAPAVPAGSWVSGWAGRDDGGARDARRRGGYSGGVSIAA
jgi:hypothetical protein